MRLRSKLLTVFLIFVLSGSAISVLISVISQNPTRYAQPPSPETYETDFWDFSEISTRPFDINNRTVGLVSTPSEDGSVNLEEWHFDFSSESYRGEDSRINSLLLWPRDYNGTMPAILFLHGYGVSFAAFRDGLLQMSAAGNVVLAIDAPGSGGSTPTPALSAQTFLNVNDGPESAHLYHSVWSAARALTLLESFSFVDNSKTILMGASMGGLESYILAAKDPRVDGVVPMISGGNWNDTVQSGSFLNSVLPPQYTLDSQEYNDMIRWYDPLGYTPEIDVPVLMCFGTKDEFFSLPGMMDTISSISAPLHLSIRPNLNHYVHSSWFSVAIHWIESTFEDITHLPTSDIIISRILSPLGGTIQVWTETNSELAHYICWRSSEPGASWALNPMSKTDDGYYGEILPTLIGKVSLFVIAMDGDLYYTTEIFESYGGSLVFPVMLILSGIGLYWIIMTDQWNLTPRKIFREFPIHAGLLLATAGFVLPSFIIHGRTSLSFLDFVEKFGSLFLLSGWFLPAIFATISFLYAISAFRHVLPLRLIVLGWFPVMLVFIGLYVVFAGFFALFGNVQLITHGIGIVCLLSAVPAMLVLERVFRTYEFGTPNLLPARENLSS